MKKILTKFIILLTIFFSINYAAEKKILLEVLTNSHCPLCPPAHTVINSYLANSANASKINYIFYHMVFPYSDDKLYNDNPLDASGRNTYYGPYSSTPHGFFNGVTQSSNYSGWGNSLDALVGEESPLEILLSGSSQSGQSLKVKAKVTRTGDISESDLVIHFVVVENLIYQGRNGISYHRHVMRKMIPSAEGEAFSIDPNETKEVEKDMSIDSKWAADSLAVVVFIQSKSSKKVYQSETINYNQLILTDVKENKNIPKSFKLDQNYPNPFNPTTKISWQSPVDGWQTLKVYDLLGNEVAVLVNEYKPAGRYEITFNASENQQHSSLPSGFYIYQLKAGNFIQTKKMILLK